MEPKESTFSLVGGKVLAQDRESVFLQLLLKNVSASPVSFHTSPCRLVGANGESKPMRLFVQKPIVLAPGETVSVLSGQCPSDSALIVPEDIRGVRGVAHLRGVSAARQLKLG
jgi:hypothetical protein